jgi:phage terminase large subunit
MLTEFAEEHVQSYASWYHNPRQFCKDVLNFTPDEWQEDPLDKIVEANRMALLGAKGVGKSRLKAAIGWWWAVTRKQAQVICTSKDEDNLSDGLWKEIGILYGESKFLQRFFTYNSEMARCREKPVDWFLAARGWRKNADPVEQAQALAGKHGPAMMWLGDEAGSYGQAIVTSGSAMLANAVPGSGIEAKVVLGGNTTDPAGPLAKIAKNRTVWAVFTINSDPDNPKRAKRVSIDWARGEIKEHGRQNPWIKVAIFAEFPDVGFTNLLGPEDIDRAKLRHYIEADYDHVQKRIGVDPAREGDDSTIITVRQGLWNGAYVQMRGADGPTVAQRVALAVTRSGAEVVFVDEIGVGYSVLDHLRLLRVRCIGVNSSSTKTDEARHYNKRAEMWCRMADWIKKGGRIPTDYPQLEEDLMVPQYTFKDSAILIEEKKQIKKRLGRSPDWADALSMTFYSVDMPAALGELGPAPGFLANDRRKQSADFDPLRSMSSGSGQDYDPLGGGRL